ncbi:hypothetical protein GCM10007971_08030 [Oceanobacillus indicireducens]|uniref:Uncharacterized protein n=1 Tax=Oceanobacillus indicireducens TaxID=1004261 RepID=A0A917XTH2_9BACI|nr:hypothetical protein GCM10007971_08030 [Oceanobacillus indicireducens]
MRTKIPFWAQIDEKYGLAIIKHEQTGTDSPVNLKCTNVRTVRAVYSAIYARRQKKETTEKSTN